MFQSAVTELRRLLRESVEKAACPSKPAEELRQELNLSEDEASQEDSMPVHLKCQRPHRRAAASGKFIEIVWRDTKLKILHKPRPLRIVCTTPAVTAIVRFCQEHVGQGHGQFRKRSGGVPQQDDAATWQMPQEECPNILKHVTWQPSVRAWCVHFKNEAGATALHKLMVRQEKCGLAQQGMDQKEFYQQLRKQRYREALQFWNTNDCSTRPRLELTS